MTRGPDLSIRQMVSTILAFVAAVGPVAILFNEAKVLVFHTYQPPVGSLAVILAVSVVIWLASRALKPAKHTVGAVHTDVNDSDFTG